MLPVSHYFFLSFGLFFIGVIGALLRRNAALIGLSIGLMVTASAINLVAFSRFFGDPAGQNFAFLLMIAALAEAIVLVSLVARRSTPHAIDHPAQSGIDSQFVQTPAPTDFTE